jgi:hypothetical protein
MRARLKIRAAAKWEKVRIDVSRDRSGEFFDLACQEDVVPEILDVQPALRHLVLMVRDGANKNKFLLGRDERHWFAAAVPGDGVHDVRTAIASLRPTEVESRHAIRQGEWFFVPERDATDKNVVIYRNEPLRRNARSKPHICEELMRRAGVPVMVSTAYPAGITLPEFDRLVSEDPAVRQMTWQRMVRDAQVFVRGSVRHRDHKTIYLDGWHRVYMNRERFAPHSFQVAFLD